MTKMLFINAVEGPFANQWAQ